MRIHTQNASQSHFHCFLKGIPILKSGCSFKSPTNVFKCIQELSQDSFLVDCWTHDQKVAHSSSIRGYFLCWLIRCLFHPVLPRWHVKDLVIIPKVHVAGYTWTHLHAWPNAQWSQSGLTVLSRHSVGTYQGNKLSHNLSAGNTWPVISACCQATVDWSWPKKWNWCVQADPHLKNKIKSAGGEWITEPSLKFLARKEIAINTTRIVKCLVLLKSTVLVHVIPYLFFST